MARAAVEDIERLVVVLSERPADRARVGARPRVAVICDTAVLIAADRRDRRAAALARAVAESGAEFVVTAGCIAQAWRDGARQAPLARFLAGCRELPLDGPAARSAASCSA